jgi:hypothetical protein
MISNFIWFLGMLNQAILFIYEILQENWVLYNWNSILAYTHYMDAKYRLYVFFLFSVLHLCLRISLSRVPMYMFLVMSLVSKWLCWDLINPFNFIRLTTWHTNVMIIHIVNILNICCALQWGIIPNNT